MGPGRHRRGLRGQLYGRAAPRQAHAGPSPARLLADGRSAARARRPIISFQMRRSPLVLKRPPHRRGLARAKAASPRGRPAFHVERRRAYAGGSELSPRPWEQGLGSIRRTSDLVVSHRHCINHPELETPSVACASRRGMLDEEARLEHRATCL